MDSRKSKWYTSPKLTANALKIGRTCPKSQAIVFQTIGEIFQPIHFSGARSARLIVSGMGTCIFTILNSNPQNPWDFSEPSPGSPLNFVPGTQQNMDEVKWPWRKLDNSPAEKHRCWEIIMKSIQTPERMCCFFCQHLQNTFMCFLVDTKIKKVARRSSVQKYSIKILVFVSLPVKYETFAWSDSFIFWHKVGHSLCLRIPGRLGVRQS